MKVTIIKPVRVLTQPGTVMEVDEATAKWLIGVGAAEKIAEVKPIETTAVKPAEKRITTKKTVKTTKE